MTDHPFERATLDACAQDDGQLSDDQLSVAAPEVGAASESKAEFVNGDDF